MATETISLILAAVALGVALVAVAVLVCVVPLLCCLWCRTRKDIRLLRSEQRRLHTVENGRKAKPTVIQEYEREPSRLSAIVPDDPPPSSPSTATPSQPQAIPEPVKGYNRINIGNLLPDELRTPDNLEMKTLPEGELGRELIEDHQRRQVEYEEWEMRQLAKPQSRESQGPPEEVRGGGGAVPGYEDIDPVDTDLYRNPADALAHVSQLPRARFSGSGLDGGAPRKLQISSVPQDGPRPDEYSDVFDHLPQSRTELIAKPPAGRGNQASSADAQRKLGGYEDVGSSSEEGMVVGKPGSLPTGSLEHLAEEDSPNRRYSMPAGRRHGVARDDKEMVSFDRKANKYMTESMRRKKDVVTTEQGSPRVNGHKESESPDGQSPSKALDSSDGSLSPDSYSVVNIADKQKYRAEEDGLKREGSGRPARYRPNEKHHDTEPTLWESTDI